MEVSIVIPTYNRKESLKSTLRSLLNQTFPINEYEIIICDDGSIDGTSELIKDFINNSPCQLKYLYQSNRGPAASRNLGVKNAKGKIIGFIDDDCVAVSTWIEAAVESFKDENVGGVQGPTLPAGSISLKDKIFNYVRTSNVSEQNYSYASCNIFYQKHLIMEVGIFDETFPVPCWGEDTDLGNRIIKMNYNIVFNQKVTVYHEIQLVPFFTYLKGLKKYESRALIVKNSSFMRKRYPLRFIGVKAHLYPLFILITTIMYLAVEISIFDFYYLYILTAITILSYLWGRVLIDFNLKMYPLRTISFPRYLLIDFIGVYYTLRGCLRFKTFLL